MHRLISAFVIRIWYKQGFAGRDSINTGRDKKYVSYRYHKLRKTFSKSYQRHYDLVSKFNTGLKSFFKQGLAEPEFNGDLVYNFKENCWSK